ncbi:MAG: type I secretion system permease/ATPase [Luminiphilus sp.]|nr:type I secretion system permease/ATPase [Luminiphilus sp.]
MGIAEDDVLLACLVIVARHHGLPATPDSLSAGLPSTEGGINASLLQRAARRVGLHSRLKKLSLESIPASVCPAILLLENGDACVYLGQNNAGSADVIYPRLVNAPVEEAFDTLEAKFTGFALLARPKFYFDSRVDSSDLKREGHWFWSAIRGNIPVYKDVLVAAFFINLFALAVPIFMMNVYDRVVPNAAFDTLWVLSTGVVLVLVADMVLKSMRGHFLDLASRRVDVDLSAKIMERTLGMRLEHRPASVGSFAVNLRSFETLRDFITSTTITTVIDLPFSVLFLAVIAWIGWPLLVPVFLGILAILTYALVSSKKLKRLTETTYQAGAQRNATLIESLTGLDTLKALGAESVMQRKWEDTTRFLAGVGVDLRLATLSVTHFTMFAQQLVTVGVIIVGVFLISEGQLTMGGLIAGSMLSRRSMQPFGQIAGLITQAHNARMALDTLNGLFETPTERREGGAFVSRDNFRGDVTFKNVSFAYPGSETASVAGVSFSVKAGEHVAIVGRVGSGKSTLTKLAMGLYEPTEGAVLIDGIDLRQLDPGEYRKAVGYVPQDVTLFHGTLRENMTLAHRGVEDDALVRAAERAALIDFVNRHPRGFDMPISERGDSVSGGQRRCIALARSLVHTPGILFFDEPTGSMDNSTEATIKKELENYLPGRTLLLVTHRNSLLELVDRIIVVDGGRIVADGAKDGVLAALKQGKIGRAR